MKKLVPSVRATVKARRIPRPDDGLMETASRPVLQARAPSDPGEAKKVQARGDRAGVKVNKAT